MQAGSDLVTAVQRGAAVCPAFDAAITGDSDDVGRAFRLMPAPGSDRSRPAAPKDVSRSGGAPAAELLRGRAHASTAMMTGGRPTRKGNSRSRDSVLGN